MIKYYTRSDAEIAYKDWHNVKNVIVSPLVRSSSMGCSKGMRTAIDTVVTIRRIIINYSRITYWFLDIYVEGFWEVFGERDFIKLDDIYFQKLLEI